MKRLAVLLVALCITAPGIARADVDDQGPLAVLVTGATASAPAVRLNPPPPRVLSTEEIIREVWAGEVQYVIDKAVRTAKRESGPNLKVDAENYCCYGIFQIYLKVHRDWLADYGVFSKYDLFDPRTNATVALALYHMDKWRPWNGGA